MRQLIYAVSGLIVFMATSAKANMIPPSNLNTVVYSKGFTENHTPCSLYAKVVNGNVEKLTIRTGERNVCSGNHHAVVCKDLKNSDVISISGAQVQNLIFREMGKRAVIRGSITLDEAATAKKLVRVDFHNGVKNGFYFSFAATGTSSFDQETRVWCYASKNISKQK